MRIAFIVTSFPELSTTFILNQITGLIDRGHEVDIYGDRPGNVRAMHPDVERYRLLERTYCPRMPRSYALRMLKGVGLFASTLPRAPLAALRSLNVVRFRQLAACVVLLYGMQPLLRRKPYDVIHCHFGPNGLKGVFFRESGLISGKLLTSFHGYDVSTYPRIYGGGVYRPLFETGDLYTANTRFAASRAVQLGCPPERIAILPESLDIGRFSFAERRLAPREEIRILTVARLVEVKGVEYGIRAVAQLAPRHPALRYQVAGDGPLRQSLEALARRLNVADRVEFLGGQPYDRLVEFYARAHIFLLPGVVARNGSVEAQGLVLAEAQASGLPVLATQAGGIPESVLDGQSAILVPPRDVDALADRLAYLIEHPDLWPTMGRAGRAYVEERYDIDRLNDRLVEIYKAVLAGQSP